MHVVHVINNLPVGGAERFLVGLAAAQQRLQVGVSVVALTPPLDLAPDLQAAGVAHTCLRHGNLNDPRLCLDLARFLRRAAPDVVHTHLFYADTAGRLAARWLRVPVVVSTEHSTEAGPMSRRRAWTMRWTARLSDRIVAVSEAVRRAALVRLGLRDDRIVVIPNGIDVEAWGAATALLRAEVGVGARRFVVGCVGRMVESKGYDVVLDALAQCADLDVGLLMVGDGPARHDLQQQAQHLGLGDRVAWLGWRTDVDRLLKTVDVFAMPSFWEGHSMALLEAMAAGCACLVSDIPELRDTIGDAGVCVTPGDASAIAGGLRALASADLRQRLGAQARQQVTRFSIDTAARRYVQLYRDLLGSRRSSAPA
jgi:glycosyltransferase involved in cell wall biosynthesis